MESSAAVKYHAVAAELGPPEIVALPLGPSKLMAYDPLPGVMVAPTLPVVDADAEAVKHPGTSSAPAHKLNANLATQ